MLIDLIILGIIALFFAMGAMQGFVVSVFYLLAWIVGILSAWLFAGSFGKMLSANIEGLIPILALCLGALLAFLIPFLIIRISTIFIKHFIRKSSPLTKINRIFGGVFGVLKGIAVSAIILTFIHFLPVKGNLEQTRDSSKAYSFYKAVPFAGLWKEFKNVS